MQRQARKLVRLRVDFSSSSAEEAFTGHGYTEDLNASGCRIESANVLPPGRYLTLRFYAPGAADAIQVELARVRWVKGRQFGVEFIRRNRESQSSLDQLVASAGDGQGIARSADSDSASHTVLLIEDNPDEMLLYSKVLHNAGHTVLQAIGSLEAMQLCLDQARIDLAIVDVVLTVPAVRLHGDTSRVRRVNGPQLIHDMVAVRKALRALLISSLDPSHMKEYGVVVGSVPFLQKPFSKDQLLDTMAMILSGPPLVSKASASKADTMPSIE